MKRLYTSTYIALFLLMGMFAFAACEVHVGDDYYDDRGRAYTLSGQWVGNFGMFYAVPHPITGQPVEFDADHTNIIFYTNYAGARRGTGKQVDYYNYGPYSYQYYYFNWEVRDRDIYLFYPSDPNLNVVIYDYYLDDYVFRGYMGSSRTRFELRALRNFNRWDSFTGNYNYGPNSGWTWGGYTQKMNPSALDAAEESFSVVPSSVNASATHPNLVRGNRLLQTAP